MVRPLLIRNDGYFRAFGKVVVAHTQLEIVLRYLVRALAGLEMIPALTETAYKNTSEVRDDLRDLVKLRKLPAVDAQRLEDMLDEARRLSKERNKLAHRAIQRGPKDRVLQLNENFKWVDAPPIADIERLADRIIQHADEINETRLTGFIAAACKTCPLPAGYKYEGRASKRARKRQSP